MSVGLDYCNLELELPQTEANRLSLIKFQSPHFAAPQ